MLQNLQKKERIINTVEVPFITLPNLTFFPPFLETTMILMSIFQAIYVMLLLFIDNLYDLGLFWNFI